MLLTNKKIGVGEYANNDSIESVSFSSSVRHIGARAFYKCSKLTAVSFNNDSKINAIGSSAFYKTNVEYLNIPDSVKIIESSAFAFCTNLKYVYFSDNSQLQVIREGAFKGCKNLIEIILPNRHVKVEKNALNFDDDLDEEKKLQYLIEKYRNKQADKGDSLEENEGIERLKNIRVSFYSQNYTPSDARHPRRPHWYKAV